MGRKTRTGAGKSKLTLYAGHHVFMTREGGKEGGEKEPWLPPAGIRREEATEGNPLAVKLVCIRAKEGKGEGSPWFVTLARSRGKKEGRWAPAGGVHHFSRKERKKKKKRGRFLPVGKKGGYHRSGRPERRFSVSCRPWGGGEKKKKVSSKKKKNAERPWY